MLSWRCCYENRALVIAVQSRGGLDLVLRLVVLLARLELDQRLWRRVRFARYQRREQLSARCLGAQGP